MLISCLKPCQTSIELRVFGLITRRSLGVKVGCVFRSDCVSPTEEAMHRKHLSEYTLNRNTLSQQTIPLDNHRFKYAMATQHKLVNEDNTIHDIDYLLLDHPLFFPNNNLNPPCDKNCNC